MVVKNAVEIGEAEELKKIRADRRLYEVMRDGTKMPPVLR